LGTSLCMSEPSPSTKKVYLDTSILAHWAVREVSQGRKLSRRAENCKELLDYYEDGKLDIVLQTSEWALSEIIQSFIDKVTWEKFPFEGFELRELRKMKKELELKSEERLELNKELDVFEQFLNGLDVQMIPVK